MQNSTDFLVCVQCCTYNQANYIEDALNGFCMQQTTFPFICAVFDDASTDGEVNVIRRYMEEHFDLQDQTIVRTEETNDYYLVFARHKSNQNCYLAVLYLKYNHYKANKRRIPYISEWFNRVKYIAICEGDDYWINPDKLQKQVDYLECHPDCTICSTNALTIWEKGAKAPSYFRKYYQERDFPITELIGNWAFATASLIYRRAILDNYPEWTKKLYFSDMSLMLIAAHYGEFHVLSDLTTVYRKSLNDESSITAALSDKMDYVNRQQVQLYDAFNEWTEGKYADIVLREIGRRKKEVKFYQYRKKGRLLPYIMMPKYMLNKRFNKHE